MEKERVREKRERSEEHGGGREGKGGRKSGRGGDESVEGGEGGEVRAWAREESVEERVEREEGDVRR